MFKIIKNNNLNLKQNDRTKMGLFILNYQRTDGETLFFHNKRRKQQTIHIF